MSKSAKWDWEWFELQRKAAAFAAETERSSRPRGPLQRAQAAIKAGIAQNKGPYLGVLHPDEERMIRYVAKILAAQ
jgi:hypothetical protein